MNIEEVLRESLINYMSNSVSKKAFLEECDNPEVINDAYDNGELTNDMFYNTVDQLISELRSKV